MTDHKYTVYPYDVVVDYDYDKQTGKPMKIPTISSSTSAFYCNAQNLDDIKKAMELLGVKEYTVNINEQMRDKEIFATALVLSTRDKDTLMEAKALAFNQHSPLFWKEQYGRFTVEIVRGEKAVYNNTWSHDKMQNGNVFVAVKYDGKLIHSPRGINRTFELNLYRYVTKDGKVLKKAFWQDETADLPEEIRLNDAISIETLVSNLACIAKALSNVRVQYHI